MKKQPLSQKEILALLQDEEGNFQKPSANIMTPPTCAQCKSLLIPEPTEHGSVIEVCPNCPVSPPR